jgi:hypothetical protein
MKAQVSPVQVGQLHFLLQSVGIAPNSAKRLKIDPSLRLHRKHTDQGEGASMG